MPNIVYIDIC